MNTIKHGASQVVNICLNIKKHEKVCIITDKETYKIAQAIKEEAKKITENITIFTMEDFGKREEIKPLRFPEKIKKYLKNSNVCIYAAGSRKGELETFRQPMFHIVEKFKVRHAHMNGITEEIMKTGMCTDYGIVRSITKKVYRTVNNAKTIHVTTQVGTDLTAEFDKDIRWIICDGNITKSKLTNLPDGEVFTCPKNVNGIAVIDGVIGDCFDKKFGRLKKNPVTLKIVNGRVLKISCENKNIENELSEHIKKDKNSNRIGEFAIGTNTGIKKIIGNILQDEKFPGVHMAIGDSYSEITGSDWNSSIHSDCVMLNCTVTVDNKKTIMKNSRFIF
ncbi:MAG: aminopeptidase [archaeon]|nr:aminopeptidase [archaeon]